MTDTAALLSVDALVAGYRPGLPIVKQVSIRLGAGEIVTIIGPNGAGKSTVIKAIAGLVHIEAGRIRIDGRDLTGTPPDRLGALGIAYVPQTANVFTTLTIGENLALAARRCRTNAAGRVVAMTELFPVLAEKRGLRASGLSGGQRQLLAIAMALIAEPSVILMDEPTAGLAPKAAEEVMGLIRRIAAEGVGVLLVEQNARLALRLSDRAYILADGRTQHEGEAATLLDDPLVGEIYLGGRRKGAA